MARKNQTENFFLPKQTSTGKGIGCGGLVGRAVASDTRGLWFESSHW